MEPAHHETIQNALDGYLSAHPTASSEEVSAFQARVEANLARRLARPGSSKEERKARRAAVVALLKEHGLRTTSWRTRKVWDITNRYGKLLETLRGPVSPNGGATLVYKVVGDQVVVAASLCSLKDNFDGVKGREDAAQRFLDGVTLTYPGYAIEDVPVKHFLRKYESLLWKLAEARKSTTPAATTAEIELTTEPSA